MESDSQNAIAHSLLMVKPHAFGHNPQTASTNAFQSSLLENNQSISSSAVNEFNQMVDALQYHGIEVLVIDDTEFPEKPDAIFPNNWMSTHPDGTVILYPMMAENRRYERRTDIISVLDNMFEIKHVLDLTHHESDNHFLEGTGSIVFDHANKLAFAAVSERTHPDIFEECCTLLGYEPLTFRAFHENGLPIYHTNVLLHISPVISAICLELIHHDDRKKVMDALYQKQLLHLTSQQVHDFAGNMLCVLNDQQIPHLIGSQKAFMSLDSNQLNMIQDTCIPVEVLIPTIEHIGGGSARCMMTELFLPEKNNT
ncbi:MAG: citrulline utilization hydrolase CtlX [Candidatus Kapaibacteriota bacterium]